MSDHKFTGSPIPSVALQESWKNYLTSMFQVQWPHLNPQVTCSWLKWPPFGKSEIHFEEIGSQICFVWWLENCSTLVQKWCVMVNSHQTSSWRSPKCHCTYHTWEPPMVRRMSLWCFKIDSKKYIIINLYPYLQSLTTFGAGSCLSKRFFKPFAAIYTPKQKTNKFGVQPWFFLF